MPKAHRAYRHTWWKKRYPFADPTSTERNKKTLVSVPVDKEERYVLPFIRYCGEGTILQVPAPEQAPLPEQNTAGQYQRRLEQNRVRREREHLGIPGGVDDALSWLYAYLKLADERNPEKPQAPLAKDEKNDYYRDLAIDLYRASGYSIEDSVRRAYSPQGDDLIRYLADDKRHPLNRNRKDEASSAV